MGHIKDRWFTGKGNAKKPSARHGKGLRWQVWHQVDGREKCGGSFAKKADAEKKLIDLESRALRGHWVDLKDPTTVAEYAWRYIAARPHKLSSAKRAKSIVKNHVAGTCFGEMRMVRVKPYDVQEWVTDRHRILSEATLLSVVRMVRAMFADAVLEKIVAETPFVRISVPSVDAERIVPLSVGQVARLADAVRPRYRAMILAQSGLGLRLGELLALRLEDVDFLRRTARVEHQIDRSTRERVPPKTPKSRRTLPLPDMVSLALAEHIRLFPPADDGLLFHTAAGLPYWRQYYSERVFNPAVIKAGVPVGTTSHDLRHHYASMLLAAGESVIAVAERLGHEDATLVLKVYGHLMPNMEDRTRKAIDAAWEAANTDLMVSDASGTAP